jgi:ABC-type sugar transport system ATPase subunit
VIPVLEVISVTKSYGASQVLSDVSLAIDGPGVFAITGENGAGKSTLLKTVAGIVRPECGTVRIYGEDITGMPRKAKRSGVAVVYQHLSLFPEMSVAENCSMARLPTRAGWVSRREVDRAADEVLERVGLNCDPRVPVQRLSFAERQLLELGKALVLNPRLLLLDEPTASLTPSEVSTLFALIREVVAQGASVGYVSHRLPEIFELCGKAFVLRDGHLVADLDLAESSPDDLVAAMVGREVELTARERANAPVATGQTRLSVRDLRAPGVNGVTLDVGSGEILGIGGLVGAGRTELMQAIFGLTSASSGSVVVDGSALRSGSTAEAIRAGMALVQEDRHRDGLALTMTSWENFAVPMYSRYRVGPFLRMRRLRAAIREQLVEGDVRPPDPGSIVGALSGGNQQKIVIGRWLSTDIRVLLLDEPTTGVDVHAKLQIHHRILEIARQGISVILVSSDLPELLSLSDRIAVMRDGQLVGQLLPGSDWTAESVISWATRGAA